jgi:hypothetical protein
MKKHARQVAAAVVVWLPLMALAEAASSDMAQGEQTASRLRYQSAFADYKPWTEVVPADWKSINDALGQNASEGHSGHSGHSSPHAASAAPAASGPVMPSKPVSKEGGHSAHHGGHQ